jgi:hypothetical protein
MKKQDGDREFYAVPNGPFSSFSSCLSIKDWAPTSLKSMLNSLRFEVHPGSTDIGDEAEQSRV